jgi:hypothetical protein
MALNGAAAHAFSHIIYKALLLMSAGAVLAATNRRKCSELGGLFLGGDQFPAGLRRGGHLRLDGKDQRRQMRAKGLGQGKGRPHRIIERRALGGLDLTNEGCEGHVYLPTS